MLIKQDIIFDDIVPANFDTGINDIIENNFKLFTNSGSGSGGYAHHIFCYAARELFNININEVEFKPLRYGSLQFTNYIMIILIILIYLILCT